MKMEGWVGPLVVVVSPSLFAAFVFTFLPHIFDLEGSSLSRFLLLQ